MADSKPTTDQQLHDWGLTLVDDGRLNRRHQEGIWWENLASYGGDLWAEWNVHRRRLTETKKPKGRVRIPINLTQPVVRTELAKLVKNRPILDCLAASDDREDLNAAKVGDKLLNNYVEREFSMPRVRRRALTWVLLCGLGGIFVDWDPSAESPIEVYRGPGDEPLFDMQKVEAFTQYYEKKKETPRKMKISQGEMVHKVVSPFQLIWDFSKIYTEDATWLIVSDVYDCDEVEKRWGTRPDAEQGVLPGVIERRVLSRFDLVSGPHSLSINQPKGQDLCEIHRLFVKPNHPFFPDGAEIVFTKNEIIEKTQFPHSHGELPVALMGHIPFPVSQHPMSTVQQIRPVVLEVSKTQSQLIENRNLMANPPWRIPKQVRLESEIQNRPGARIRYNHVPNVPAPEPVQMPNMPQYVKELLEALKQNIQEISGQGETSQGRIPPGARSGVAVAYLQEEDDTRLGPTVAEFEEMMENWGFLTLKTMAEKYDIPRTVSIYRRGGAPEVFDFMGRMLDSVVGVQCQAGSALPRSKAAKQQFILDLWDRKLEQDPRRVREMLELSSGEPDEWDIDIDQAERENSRMSNGEEVQVEPWHNHPAHHYQHRNFMKSADWEAMSEELKQAFRDHDQAHSDEEAREQQQQAQMQPQPPGGGDQTMPPQMGGPASAASNGANQPEGPPPQFQPGESPRDLMDAGPQ